MRILTSVVLLALCCTYLPRNSSQSALEALGHKLFFDQRLSATGTRACATCHDPRFAFTDGYRTSPGLWGDTLRRNAPTLINIGRMPVLNWANPHIRSLESQLEGPFFNNNPPELGLTRSHSDYLKPLDSVWQEIGRDSTYVALLQRAFDPKNKTKPLEKIATAITAYERTLVSFNSPYDHAQRMARPLVPARAEQGRQLFWSSQSGCTNCHSGQLFSDGQYHYCGFGDSNDQGLYEATGRLADTLCFRTPMLRNLGFTAPYFHDGRVATLPQALKKHAPHLDEVQRMDLLFFLETLNDSTVLRFVPALVED